jgi:hypothetical protein
LRKTANTATRQSTNKVQSTWALEYLLEDKGEHLEPQLIEVVNSPFD